MKVKKLDNIEERFNDEHALETHYDQHVTTGGETSDPNHPNDRNFVKGYDFKEKKEGGLQEYNKAADDLARRRAVGITSKNTSDVVGFMEEVLHRGRHRICKYCPQTREFTTYTVENGEPINISYYYMNPERWERLKKDGRGCLPIPKEMEDAICRD